MVTIKDFAKEYEPKKTRIITDLEIVNLSTVPVEEREGRDKDTGKPYKYNVGIVDNEEYRIPDTVMKDIKTILEAKPNLKTVKVIKKGQGMGTTYTVIPLE